MEIVGQVEIDEYCQKILKLRWPDVPKWRDIKEVRGSEVIERCGRIDLISGGFPCQPFSDAGKRKGKSDDRYLWPEMLRVISEVKPAFVFGENVTGIIKSALDTVLSDLEGIGYTCQTFIIPACGVDAPHRRYRIWIIAYSQHNRLGYVESGNESRNINKEKTDVVCEALADAKSAECEGKWRKTRTGGGKSGRCSWWPSEPRVGRVANGLPNQVDRLKMLGNGQVVQVVQWIGEQIMKFEADRKDIHRE
jgi:DNA (cytosine-5)-methyltransferase 1